MLATHKIGRRVLLYLLAPRSTRHFIPSIIKDLETTDELAAQTSKKDKDVRRKELRSAISPYLIEMLCEAPADQSEEDENKSRVSAEELVRDAGASLLVIEIMLEAEGDKTKAIEALVKPLGAAPYPNPASVDPEQDPATAPILDLSYADRAYKTILMGGRFNPTTKSAEAPNTQLKSQFGEAFWEALTSEEVGGERNAVNLALGNAPFVVVELVDNLLGSKYEKDVKRVLGNKQVVADVEKSWRKGAKVLHEKLSSL